MTKTTLIRFAVSALIASSLSSCADKYWEDPTLELYTRAFIKEFGLIDPQQDWNMAEKTSVSIELGSMTPNMVKVYTLTDDKYYLVARLQGVTGHLDVPIQVPEGTKDVMVKVDGDKFYGTIGSTINCTGAPASRDIYGDGSSYTSGNNGDYQVTVTYATTGNLYDQRVEKLLGKDGELEEKVVGVSPFIYYGKDYTTSDYTISGVTIPNFNLDTCENQTYPYSRYQYFNTQQILPIVANGDGTGTINYYSLNTKRWSRNKDQGILPENGDKNQYAANIPKDPSLIPDAIIELGSTGKIVVFPYYYNATYIHTFGIYLAGADGKTPVKDSNGNIIKFPVFNDKQPGDIQIAIKLAGITDIEGGYWTQEEGEEPVWHSTGNDIYLPASSEVNLYDYVRVKNASGYVDDYPDGYSSKLGFHCYSGNVGNITFDRAGDVTTPASSNDITDFEIAAEGYMEKFTIKIGATPPSGGGSTTPSVVGGGGDNRQTMNYWADPDNGGKVSLYFYYAVNQGVNCSAWPSSLLSYIDSDKKFTFTPPSDQNYINFKNAFLALYTSTTNNLDLGSWETGTGTWKFASSLPDPNDYDISIQSEDYSADNKNYLKFDIVFTPKSTTPSTPSSTTYNHTYTINGTSWLINDPTWDSFFEQKTSSETETITYTGEYTGTWMEDHNVTASSLNGATLRIYYTATGSNPMIWFKTSWNQLVADTEEYTVSTSDAYHDFTFTEDGITQLNNQGGLKIGCSDLKITKISIVTVSANPITYWDWKDDGKADAKSALETFYASKNPGTKKCQTSNCGNHDGEGMVNFSGVVPVVTINSSADKDNVSYTVTWTKPDTVTSSKPARKAAAKPARKTAAKPAHSNMPRQKAPTRRSARSRDEAAMPSILQYPNTEGWSETNKIWNRKRPLHDEAASFIVDAPVLARSRGYEINVKNPDGTAYSGFIGFYIDVYENPAAANNGSYDTWLNDWVDYNTNNLGGSVTTNKRKEDGTIDEVDVTANLTYKYTLYSQKSLNSQDINGNDGGDYPMSYAMAFPHPVSGRDFYSFEDWRVAHPAVGDKDKNDMALTSGSYSDSDYSSDRDFNDLIYAIQRFQGSRIVPDDKTDKDEEEEGYSWIWALEDLGATDDFDFNDIVVKINAITEGSRDKTTTYDPETLEPSISYGEWSYVYRVTLTPMAAGGTLPIYIHFVYKNADYILSPTGLAPFNLNDNSNLPPTDDGAEYHTWFGSSWTYQYMINTGLNSVTVNPSTMSCVMILDQVFDLGTGIQDAKNNGFFYATVLGPKAETTNEEISSAYSIPSAELGVATQSFLIYCGREDKDNTLNGVWRWPKERKPITTAYPHFRDWVGDKTKTFDDGQGNMKPWTYFFESSLVY